MSAAESGNTFFEAWIDLIVAEEKTTAESFKSLKEHAKHMAIVVNEYLDIRSLGLFDGTFEGERDMVAQADFLCRAAGIEPPENIEFYLLIHTE